jgi:uncharacterized RDD family membrane protein YckC
MENQTMQQHTLASPGHRIAAAAVDVGLHLVTLGIGWFIWNLVTMAKGQSPAKSLLKVRVINNAMGTPATWGQMFVRQALLPIALSVFYLIPYYIWIFKGFTSDVNPIAFVALGLSVAAYVAISIMDLVWLFGPRHRRLIDYWAGTIVVNEAK